MSQDGFPTEAMFDALNGDFDMDPREIREVMRPDKFEPCVFITDTGERYEVRQRRFVFLVTDGTVHIYEPSDREDATVESWVRVPFDKIVAIEPLAKQSA